MSLKDLKRDHKVKKLALFSCLPALFEELQGLDVFLAELYK